MNGTYATPASIPPAVSAALATGTVVVDAAEAAVAGVVADLNLSYTLTWTITDTFQTPTLVRGATAFSTTAKFGSHALSGGVQKYAGADDFLVSTPNFGGTILVGTLEAWVRMPANPPAVRVIASHALWYWMGINASGQVLVKYGDPEATLQSTIAICDGNWHHVALVFKAGSVATLYVDGVQAATNTATKTIGATGYGFCIGGLESSTAYDWSASSGLIDEVRLSDVARYTAAFTPPATAFAWDANTKRLARLDNSTLAVTASGGAYPARPATTDGGVTWIGPVEPTGWHTYDRWVQA